MAKKNKRGKIQVFKKIIKGGPWLQSTEPCKVNFNFLNNKFRLCVYLPKHTSYLIMLMCTNNFECFELQNYF